GFEQRSHEAVMRDKNHACVVMWGIGNENHPGRDNARAAAITRELDPTRPRLISCQKADEGTEPVDFDDEHYITPQQIHRAETNAKRRAKWPRIYTENPNVWEERNGPDYGSLDAWAPVIVRTWNELWQDEHVCGNFLWEWQDRAVADKNPTKYYYFFPETGINLLKVKGVVDGFRDPRPEFFHIKMAQSPIALGSQCEMEPGGFAVIPITNRYSFTDLKDLAVKWTLRRGAKHWSGALQFSLAPRSNGELRLSFPEARLAEAETLEVAFDHPSGWNVITCAYPLKPVSHAVPKIQTDIALRFPRFNFVTGVVTNDGKGWRKLDRFVGELTDVKVARRGQAEQASSAEALYGLPLAEVTSVEADVVLQPGGKSVGHLHADCSGGKLSYHLAWTGKPKTDVYEFGWRFAAPKGADRFSWDREALWSWYPETHIGRPHGTARPDSARVQLTKVDRPDAFDFNSTKFNCNWASLADKRGRGVGVSFSPDAREHVRGEIEQDGSYALVVNRAYSPPHDISSPIVPDLYTTLGKNGELSGSFQVIGLQ
ncbi:MAG TPA: glycoside hydrolase family 2 TIM barrel-domain containing protein, partial [Verrucomicrobiae bacterium]|nr:glycoside hydrolase family 2 TIM barrel-domain containing protein [Verrucomicrobiae bacterium]